MQRTQIYLTDEQRRRVSRLAADAGVSQAAMIRKILDDALDVDDGLADRLAAIDATAGIIPDAPDWREWLAAVRPQDADARLTELGL